MEPLRDLCSEPRFALQYISVLLQVEIIAASSTPSIDLSPLKGSCNDPPAKATFSRTSMGAVLWLSPRATIGMSANLIRRLCSISILRGCWRGCVSAVSLAMGAHRQLRQSPFYNRSRLPVRWGLEENDTMPIKILLTLSLLMTTTACSVSGALPETFSTVTKSSHGNLHGISDGSQPMYHTLVADLAAESRLSQHGLR